MERRTFIAGLASLPGLLPQTLWAVDFAPVLPGHPLQFPADHGAHPEFRSEWWYATGWLRPPDGKPLGFQITFFRVRTGIGEDSTSRFAPRQLLMAQAAVSDPAHGRLRHAERAVRAGFGRAGYTTDTTNVYIGDWDFRLSGDHYLAQVHADDFSYSLQLTPDAPPMLNGQGGFSTKAPDPRHASYYYSRPQLRVSGQLTIDGRQQPVTGHAWLDHEWSSELLAKDAQGWDWVGINLTDGEALMAFRLRDTKGEALWAAATLRSADKKPRIFTPGEITFTPRRQWRSPRTGIDYPVAWQLQIGERQFTLEPLMDDQELDSRRSTGAIYWEGAVRVTENQRAAGEGYLEMTGYGERIQVG
jgi:predicted secreted hydrolase